MQAQKLCFLQCIFIEFPCLQCSWGLLVALTGKAAAGTLGICSQRQHVPCSPQSLGFTQPTSASEPLPSISLPPFLRKQGSGEQKPGQEGFVQPHVAPQKSIHILPGLFPQKGEKHLCRTNSFGLGINRSRFVELKTY